MLTPNPELAELLAAATDKQEWGAIFVDAFTGDGDIRVECTTVGAEESFRDCKLSGPVVFDGQKITSFGTASNSLSYGAVDLSVGEHFLSIANGSHFVQGTLGLPGSGCDFIMAENPTTSNGFGFGSLSIYAPAHLPDGPPVPEPEGEVAVGDPFTTMRFLNTSESAVEDEPITFGHVFKDGQFPGLDAGVALRKGVAIIPCQLDVKATHSDGTVRHGIVSAVIPTIAGDAEVECELIRTIGASATPAEPSDFAELDATVSIDEGGVAYSASLADLLDTASYRTWLAGDVCSEWLVTAPLVSSSDVEHPSIHARFEVRAYKEMDCARVSIILENTWLEINEEAATGNIWKSTTSTSDITYDVVLSVGGDPVYSQEGLKHDVRTRWRKVFWWRAPEPSIHIKHNTEYLVESLAVPNYDLSVTPESSLSQREDFDTRSGPMQRGIAAAAMGTTGGRPDIGLLPGWTVKYLLDMSEDAKYVTLGQGNQSGSWRVHFRDKAADRPIRMIDYPYAGLIGTDGNSYNPATGRQEKFPPITTSSINTPDVAHHPDQAYVPYLVTGDHYYLEELQFWAMYCALNQNPNVDYRNAGAGLMKDSQVRAMGWAYRSLSHAGYITPDGDEMKSQFHGLLASNIAWLDSIYTSGTGGQYTLGAVTNGYAYAYNDGRGIAPWQHDHLTSAVGRVVELGYSDWLPFLTYLARFSKGRLLSGSDFCWALAAKYSLIIRPSSASQTRYESFADVYEQSIPEGIRETECGSSAMAAAFNAQPGAANTHLAGDFFGNETSPFVDSGYVSNMQPAIAYCATHGVPGSGDAWDVYDGRTQKQTFSSSPQFAVIPRGGE